MNARLELWTVGAQWEIAANFNCPALGQGNARRFETHGEALAWARSEFGIDVAACLDHDGAAEVSP